MLLYDFERSLIFWVLTTAHALERALNEELAPHGITYRQWQVLGWLVVEGPMSQSALADRMRIEAPTLAGIVDRMERAGWLVRDPCPADRRRKLLRLTDKVDPIWSRITEAARQVRSRAAGGIDAEHHQQLISWLAAIQENLRRPAEEAGGPP